MQIGIVGLGRMGANMARRLARGGAQVTAFDQAESARDALREESGIECVENLAALAAQLAGERVILLSLPAGAATADTLDALVPLLSAGDTLIDGGNAYYKDSMARSLKLSQHGLRYIDAGVSGGVHGLANGYCLMLGGTPKSIEMFEPFAKMVHNGIEYGMMQALAEGFSLLAARKDLEFDLGRLAETWRHGSVVRSWLLDLCAQILQQHEELDAVAPVVADSGEGRWTAVEAVELGVPTPVMSLALMARFASQGRSDYAGRLLAMMRAGFGGHAVKKA